LLGCFIYLIPVQNKVHQTTFFAKRKKCDKHISCRIDTKAEPLVEYLTLGIQNQQNFALMS